MGVLGAPAGTGPASQEGATTTQSPGKERGAVIDRPTLLIKLIALDLVVTYLIVSYSVTVLYIVLTGHY